MLILLTAFHTLDISIQDQRPFPGLACKLYNDNVKEHTLTSALAYYTGFYNPSNFFACVWLVLTRHMTKYSTAKIGEYPRIFPNFQNCACCEKDSKDKHNSFHLGRKYARIVPWTLSVPHSFPQATLSENCLLLRTDDVRKQISQHFFVPNGGYCLYYSFQDGSVVQILRVFFPPSTLPRKCKSSPMLLSRAKNWRQVSKSHAIPCMSPGSTPWDKHITEIGYLIHWNLRRALRTSYA